MGDIQPQAIKTGVLSLDDGEEEIPRLISKPLFSTLTEYILSLMPSERNVIFTMNEYAICNLYPAYDLLREKDKDRPTHVIIFAFRIINNDVYQPIGGTLVYDDFDVTDVVAECIKAFINDLWKLGLYVVGSVSPPTDTFKKIFKHIITNRDLDKYTGVLSYSVHPFEEIVHVYDLQLLERTLVTNFERRMISFRQPDPENLSATKVVVAAWADVLTALNANDELDKLAKAFNIKEVVPERVNIFTKDMLLRLMELLDKDYDVVGTLILVHSIYSVLTEIETDFAIKNKADWKWIMENVRIVLSSALFRKESVLDKKMPEETLLDSDSDTPEENTEPPVYANEQETEEVLETNNESQNCDKDGNNNGLEEDPGEQLDGNVLTRPPFLLVLPALLSAKCTIETFDGKLYMKENNGEKAGCSSDLNGIIDSVRSQRAYERLRITDDFLCSIEGINLLLEKFQKRRLKRVKVNLFNVEHLDDFMGMLKEKNRLVFVPRLNGLTYNLLHEDVAFASMESDHSLYSIKKVPLVQEEKTVKKKKRRAKNKEQNVADKKTEE